MLNLIRSVRIEYTNGSYSMLGEDWTAELWRASQKTHLPPARLLEVALGAFVCGVYVTESDLTDGPARDKGEAS